MYLSAAELLDLEHARLRLRRYGFVLDRGRMVREAIAILLADLDARGKDSLVARRIRSIQEEAGADHDGSAAGGADDANGRQVNGSQVSGSQDKDEDAVPSLGTTLFLISLGTGTTGQGQKRE